MNPFFSPKDPREEIILSIDFTPTLRPGELIMSATWSIVRENGTEDTAPMFMGNVDYSIQPVVSQKVRGGTLGGTYIHSAVATTTQRILVHSVRQQVRWGA